MRSCRCRTHEFITVRPHALVHPRAVRAHDPAAVPHPPSSLTLNPHMLSTPLTPRRSSHSDPGMVALVLKRTPGGPCHGIQALAGRRFRGQQSMTTVAALLLLIMQRYAALGKACPADGAGSSPPAVCPIPSDIVCSCVPCLHPLSNSSLSPSPSTTLTLQCQIDSYSLPDRD